MDWLTDTCDAPEATGTAVAMIEEHLRRHAVDPAAVDAAREQVLADLSRASLAAAGRPLHVHLDWTASLPVLTTARVDAGEAGLAQVPTDRPVPAHLRGTVRTWARSELVRTELRVVRRSRRTFAAGPPPVVDAAVDPSTQGPAAVAVALVAALEAHPTSSPPQAATIAGALIALAGVEQGAVVDPGAAAEAFVRMHEALGSEAYVVAADDDVIELAVARCPFASRHGGSRALCHVSSGLAGQLGARVRGTATVLLDETIVAGDPECHLQVRLAATAPEAPGTETFHWPPRTAPPPETVPNLDLSVSLPRESVSVPVVRRLAAQALRAFGVHEEDVDDVQLAITEACANVIDHAGATDTYDVKVELSADRCAITVLDQGGGFDAATVPARPLEDSEGGRGLALMRALVDNVAFRNEPRAGAVVHMVKSLRYDADHPLRRR